MTARAAQRAKTTSKRRPRAAAPTKKRVTRIGLDPYARLKDRLFEVFLVGGDMVRIRLHFAGGLAKNVVRIGGLPYLAGFISRPLFSEDGGSVATFSPFSFGVIAISDIGLAHEVDAFLEAIRSTDNEPLDPA